MKVNELFESRPVRQDFTDDKHTDMLKLKARLELSDNYDGTLDISGYKNISSLKGCPKRITGTFRCSNTAITSLKYGPKHVGISYSLNETKITSLEGIAPYIGQCLFASFITTLNSLHDIHKQIKHVKELKIINTSITSHVLGLLLIDGLDQVDNSLASGRPKLVAGKMPLRNSEWANIVNKYLPNTRGNDAVFECQQELIDAGLDEYAQL